MKSNDDNLFLKIGGGKELPNSFSNKSENLEITIPDSLKASYKRIHPFIKKFQKNIKEAGDNVEKIDNAIWEYRINFERFKGNKDSSPLEIKAINIIEVLSWMKLNWKEICELFIIPEADEDGQTKKLEDLIFELHDLDIIENEIDKGHMNRDPNIPIKITNRFEKILNTLGVQSIGDLALLCDGGIATKPMWGIPKRVDNSPEIYVLMPFKKSFDKVYETLIKNVAEKLPSDPLAPNLLDAKGRSIERADESYVPGAVMSKVWNGIYNAKLIIADCTGKSTNVFYEMAIAHAINKPTMIITQNENHIPFDIQHLGYIHYIAESKEDLKLLAEKLIKGIEKLEIF